MEWQKKELDIAIKNSYNLTLKFNEIAKLFGWDVMSVEYSGAPEDFTWDMVIEKVREMKDNERQAFEAGFVRGVEEGRCLEFYGKTDPYDGFYKAWIEE